MPLDHIHFFCFTMLYFLLIHLHEWQVFAILTLSFNTNKKGERQWKNNQKLNQIILLLYFILATTVTVWKKIKPQGQSNQVRHGVFACFDRTNNMKTKTITINLLWLFGLFRFCDDDVIRFVILCLRCVFHTENKVWRLLNRSPRKFERWWSIK